MNDHKLVVRRAEEILPALREGLALLPGCRDRQSRPLLFIPSKDQSVNIENIRNVLLYLYEVTAEDARSNGITIVIDMRGKQPSGNAKSFLKAIDDLSNSAPVSSVLVIKPDKLFSSLGLSKGSIKADVQWIGADQLIKFVDVTQVPREIGGSYPYHHEEWLMIRIELERWIWKMTNIMAGLEELRKSMDTDARGGDVQTIKRLIDTHNTIRERILNLCPIETLHSEQNNLSLMVNNPQSGVHNPDLKAALPYTKNLIDSCVKRKEEVYQSWKDKYEELENIYQFKLYESDADEKLRWIRKHQGYLQQTMGDIGNNEQEANERLKHFDDVEKAVKNSDVTVDQLQNRSTRLKSVGTPHRSKVDITDRQIREEWDRLKLALIKRRTIVTSAAAFFRCSGQYFSRYRAWFAQPGVDPNTVDPRNDAQLDEAITQHEEYWKQVVDVYVDAVNTGSQLKQHLKTGEALEGQMTVVNNRVHELGKAHKELYELWRKNKVRLHSMLALTAFQTDTQRVFEWLNEHGDPYLARNTRIGTDQQEASVLQKNHESFRRIANNTYGNAQKLFEACNTITQSGVADSERMNRLIGDLEARLMDFKNKSDTRKRILDHSKLFYTHYNELTSWYQKMEAKYGQWLASEDLNECEAGKETWVQENDETAVAYATTIGEGNDLINQLRANQSTFDADYGASIARILELMTRLEEENARFVNRWTIQRQVLDISCNYAVFLRDVTEVRQQITNWEEDMRGMVAAPTFIEHANKVRPFHMDNHQKVREAVGQIKNFSKELLQAIHGNQLTGMKTRDGRLLVDVVQENIRVLDRAERQVTELAKQTSEKIEYALKYNQLTKYASQIIDYYKSLEHQMYEMGAIPDKFSDAQKASDKHTHFKAELEKNEANSEATIRFFRLFNELLNSNQIPREYLVRHNEEINNQRRRVYALTEERFKLLQLAVMYYKTDSSLAPILDQLEKMSSTPAQHYCRETEVEPIAKELSKHEEWKEKFVKSFHYAQKTSDQFIKYIGRANNGRNTREINTRIEYVYNRKSELRERQLRLFAMWSEKKKILESCQQFVLLQMAKKEEMDWLEGEGSSQLMRFQSRAKQISPATKDSILEEFSRFKIAVKEKRTKIQTLLNFYKDYLSEGGEHRPEMERSIVQIRDRAEQFFRSFADCETNLRGGRPTGNKDELSLDRNSDHSVGERLEAVGSVVSKEMKKMREPVEELIKTEREYVKQLQQCVEIYIREFDSAAANLPLTLRGRRREIFSNIEDIFKFHEKIFLPELLKYETDPDSVGCSFTFHVDCLNSLYTEYCTNKDTRDHKEIMDLPDFISYFGKLRDKHGIDNLPSMLIKPVQRITRYGLMIQQLLKMTEAVVRAEGVTRSHRNLEEIRDAYEVVLSLPKRANDNMHYINLDKEKLDPVSLGSFVMQDTLTVWESKAFLNKKGKDRQVFLFEMVIVIAKKLDMPSKTVRYVPKGKIHSLNQITVVEHVEGDVCRFGIRSGNESSSNENRIDLKAKDEKEKIAWIRRIRELQESLSMPRGGNWETSSRGSLGSSSQTPRSSKISTSSGERLSRDGDSFSQASTALLGDCGGGQRHSVQSYDSSEGATDQWLIRSDFEASADGQLTVKSGEKVETLDQQPTDKGDWLHVVVVDEPHRTGLVPMNILLHDQPSSSTDRPDTNNGTSVVKRKSLRRIFANSTKEQKNSSSSSSATAASAAAAALPPAFPTSSSSQPEPTTAAQQPQPPQLPASNNLLPAEVPVIVSSAAPDTTPADDEPLEGLPPPMEELSLNSTAAHMNEETKEGSIREEESDAPKADEKSPEEVARFKRHYVLMELVETEKDYVRDLTSVVEGYIANLEQMELPAELQGKDKIIFANIAQILEFHKTSFLKEIEKCLENYEAAGSAFVKYQRRLDVLYVKYCQNKPKSDYLVSQDDFEAFFAETKAKLGHKVALCDLLIKPVQRIMKYQLLLKDILRYTERAKDPTNTLKAALQVMHVVPKACDDMMQVGRLQNFDGNLTAQGRLIYQGTLSIAETSGSNTPKPKDRRIFLFEQSAIIADHIPPKNNYGNPTYIFKNQIMVNKMQFQKNVSADEPLKFIIGSTDTTTPNFVAIAQTQEEKDEWVQKLEDMLDQQKRMLEQLVNPKKFMGGDDIAGGLGAMSLGGSKAPPAKNPPATKPATPKPESPKKSKLFGFGKSKPSSKTPSSPP